MNHRREQNDKHSVSEEINEQRTVEGKNSLQVVGNVPFLSHLWRFQTVGMQASEMFEVNALLAKGFAQYDL